MRTQMNMMMKVMENISMKLKEGGRQQVSFQRGKTHEEASTSQREGRFPSQPEINPRNLHHVNHAIYDVLEISENIESMYAISNLRNGKVDHFD
ncbi:unnamed protein product [Spirodela intermedia]|uniref:Uncharacterized protein n=1 Tax=Spirodela intermedia TaxID=51605 RepID=A0A7I8K743_SPIIN|nr:unnamed protein product [Spirodela intermedia]